MRIDEIYEFIKYEINEWLHPHNLNTGRDQRHLFSSILQLVGEFVDEGRALVKTQAEVTREFVLSEPVRPKL